MLDLMRKNVRSILVKTIITLVVLSFIGTIFLVWGVGDQKEQTGKVLATVFGEEVPYLEYVNEYRQLYEYYRNQFKNNWSEDMAEKLQLKKMALDNVINRRVLIHEALQYGISVRDEEVMDTIKNMPVFQQNGHFDPQHYARILEYGMHMEAAAFEDQIKRSLMIDRVKERITGGIKVSRKELLDLYLQQNEKIQAEYILLSPDQFTSQSAASDDEIKNFFEEHKHDYELPAQRRVQYVYINAHDFKNRVSIGEESIQKYYESHKNQYYLPKQVRARHILIKTTPQDDAARKEGAKKEAEDLLKRIKEGEDFAKLAQEFSKDPGSAAKGGDLGYFEKGRMTRSFEEAAFSLDKGEVSGVVESPFGYHIIKVEDIQESHTRPFEEVKGEILTLLHEEEAREIAENEAHSLVRNFYKTGKLEEEAIQAEYQIGQTEFAESDKTIPGIGPSEDIRKAAFELKKDEVSMPIQANTGFYVLRLLEEIPPHLPKLAEVKEKVLQAVQKNKAEVKAKEVAEEIAGKLSKGGDLKEVAQEYQLTVRDTGEISHHGYIKGLGSNEELTNALFSLKEGEFTPVIHMTRGYCLALLKKRVSVDLKKFDEEESLLREQVLQSKEQQLLNVWVERLKKKHNIIVDYKSV